MSATPHNVPASTSSFATEEKRSGGIAWSGSLVGSQNPDPNALGYRYSHAHKRYKRSNDEDTDATIPANVVVKFQNREGQELGDVPLDIPTQSNVDDLSALVHSMLQDNNDNNDDNRKVPYSFYANIVQKENGQETVETTELVEMDHVSTLGGFLKRHALSSEETLVLVYHPLAVFRVRPVSRCTDTLPGHTDAILHVSYSPDGQRLVSGGGDTTVRFWDVHTGTPQQVCHDLHRNHVLCTAWSPDGESFATADKNGILVLWKKPTPQQSQQDDPNNDNNDDKTQKKKKNKKHMVGKAIRAHCPKWITSIAWEPLYTPNNNSKCQGRLATSSKDGTVKIWNARTHQRLCTLSGHTDSVECVKWGQFLYTASRDRTIKVWTCEGKLIKTLKGHAHRINTLALSTDYLYRTGPYNHEGKYYTSSTTSSTSKETTAESAAKQKYLDLWGGNNNNQETQERLVSGSDDYTLFLWNPTVSKHPVKRLVGHQQLVNDMAFSPDGRYLVSASFDKKVKLWNGTTGAFLTTLTGHVGAVYRLAWSPDSRFVVSASKDSTTILWEIQPGGKAKRIQTLPGHADEVYALDWNPNGSSVATGSKDRTIKVWKH